MERNCNRKRHLHLRGKDDKGFDHRHAPHSKAKNNFRRHQHHHQYRNTNHRRNQGTLQREVETDNAQKPVQLADLPWDIIFHVLSWLPTKSLVRFRAVSKTWFRFLTWDFHFINLHCNHVLRDQTDNFILSRINYLYFIEKQKHRWNVTKLPFKHELQHGLEVVDTCNGLLCLAYGSNLPTYIYNPVTREGQKIPQLKLYLFCNRPTFCFDAKTNKYKLLVMGNSDCGLGNLAGYILTLGETCWRKLDVPNDAGFLYVFEEPKSVCCSGELYWIFKNDTWSGDLDKCILSMDISNEKFRIINFPKNVSWKEFYDREVFRSEPCVIVFRKYLTLVAITYMWSIENPVQVHIWQLVNHEKIIWSNRRTYGGVFPDGLVKVLGTVNDDSLLLSIKLKHGYDLCVYTPESEIVDSVASAIPSDFNVFPFVPSLVSVPTTSEPSYSLQLGGR